jgi:hypothetical protein
MQQQNILCERGFFENLKKQKNKNVDSLLYILLYIIMDNHYTDPQELKSMPIYDIDL